jgi:hypothetical protein
MTVFAFDRDWTVDVNPHPRHDAVPLEWVRHLAHETDHAVYAIGNQDLADEAAIPGVVDIVGRHPDDWDEWLGEKQPDGRYEQFPLRRERLSLIADLHPDADGYVVVDDLDLSDVDGWEHYHAWDFVPAVRTGDIDPSLPWCSPRADGGSPTTPRITQPDIDGLQAFLDEHADADAFEIAYRGDEARNNRLITDASMVERTVRRPAAAITIECTALPPSAEPFRVRLDDIHSLQTAEPPADLFTIDGETPMARAQSLADIAATAPDQVELATVIDLLDSDDSTVRETVLDAIQSFANSRPEDSLAVLPTLRSHLADDTHATPVLKCLATLATARPSDIAPFVTETIPYLLTDDAQQQRLAARIISEVANEHPTDVVDAVPALSAIVSNQLAGFEHALFALNRTAAEHPDEVRPAASALSAVLEDDSLGVERRLNATATLGRIASEHPDAAVDAIDPVVDLLDADAQRLRANAAGVLGDVATAHANELVPHIDQLAALLESDDDYALVNTTAALSRVADTNPTAVEHLTDQYIALLDHDHRLVRLNACSMLGHVRADPAASRLDDVRINDDDERVRNRAAWALTEVTDGE